MMGEFWKAVRKQAVKHVYALLTKAGFNLLAEKSDSGSSGGQVKEYLGFIIDTRTMRVSAPARKIKVAYEVMKRIAFTSQ